MRKLLLLALSMAWAFQIFAETIPEQKAYDIAERFFTKGRALSVSPLSADAPLQLAERSTSYYAFTRGDAGGYVIVAADNLFGKDVIGYADSGTFDADNLPEGLRWWLGECDRALEYARSQGLKPQNTAAHADYADITPLLSCKWGQDAPYNEECPAVNGVKAPTGCVATALSQIIYYNKYPATGYAGHAYDYAAMTDTYSATSTAAAKNAVAQLMHDVGLACNMNYGASVSGALNIDGARAMVNHFGYDKSAILLSRDFYNAEEWTEMLYNSLVEGSPVFYAGLNASAGHAFVCDGYRDGYFHFNWGWEGISNGYFLLDALNPKDQGTGGSSSGYNLQQEAIFNLKPASGENFTTLMYCYSGFDVTVKGHTFASTATFTGSFLNYSLVSKDVTLGLKVVGSDNSVTWLAGDHTGTLDTYGGPNRFNVAMSAFPTAEGRYTVVPAYRDNDSGTWHEMRVNTTLDKTHLIATVAGNKISFANSSASGKPQLDFGGWATAPSPGVAGKKLSVSVNITNNGMDYADEIRFVMNNYTTGETAATSSPVAISITSGDTEAITFEMTAPTTSGMYKCLVLDSKNEQLNAVPPYLSIAENTGEAEFALNLSALTVENASSVPVDNVKITARIECTSGAYTASPIELRIMQGTRTVCTKSQTVSIEAGSAQTLTFDGKFDGLEEGKTYTAAIYYKKDDVWTQLGSSATFTTASQPAALTLSLTEVKIENENSFSISNPKITVKVTCESGTYNGQVKMTITQGTKTICYKTKNISFASAGLTKSIEYSGTAFYGLQKGQTYTVNFTYYLDGQWLQLGEPYSLTTESDAPSLSIGEIATDSAPAATSIYNLLGVRLLHFSAGTPLDTTSLPAGTYIIVSGNKSQRIVIRK